MSVVRFQRRLLQEPALFDSIGLSPEGLVVAARQARDPTDGAFLATSKWDRVRN
jgi:hypothetical protein